ncbi:MAG: lipopolysaccharide biosynthesis protein [Planctomycetota bacterium]
MLLGVLVQLLGFNIVGAITRFYFDSEDPRESRGRRRVEHDRGRCPAWTVIGALLLVFRHELAPIVLARSSGNVSRRRDLDGDAARAPDGSVPAHDAVRLHLPADPAALGLFATISLVKFTFELGLRIYLVGPGGWGVVGFFVPVLLGEALTTLFLTGWVLWRTRLRLSWQALRPMLAYTLPLIPVGVLQFGLHYGDKKLLALFTPADESLHQVGIYGIGYKIGFIVTAAMLGPFVQIFHPWIYGVSDPGEQRRNLARASTYGVVAMTFASLFVVTFAKEALDWLPKNKDFVLAWRVVPYIASGYVLWAVYHLSQIPLYIAKKNGPLVWINLLALCSNVLLNALLVPEYGFVGAGIATLATFAILAALGLYVGARATGTHFEYGRMLRTLAAMAGASALALWADANVPSDGPDGPWANLAVKTVGLVVFAAWLWLGVVTRDERSELGKWIARKLGGTAANGEA